MENASAAETPVRSLLERLSQQLSTTATAQAVYGTPVERDGLTPSFRWRGRASSFEVA